MLQMECLTLPENGKSTSSSMFHHLRIRTRNQNKLKGKPEARRDPAFSKNHLQQCGLRQEQGLACYHFNVLRGWHPVIWSLIPDWFGVPSRTDLVFHTLQALAGPPVCLNPAAELVAFSTAKSATVSRTHITANRLSFAYHWHHTN